jgi:hypothetical protein
VRKASVTHTFDCSADAFWKAFLDDAYTTRLYLEGLGFPRIEILKRTETTRVMRVVPKMNVPAPIAKLIGNSFAYEDHGSLDRATETWRWQMLPGVTQSSLKMVTEGSVKIEAIGETQVRRIDSVAIEAKVFGLGSIIESTAENEVRSGWEKEATFLKNWLRDHP